MKEEKKDGYFGGGNRPNFNMNLHLMADFDGILPYRKKDYRNIINLSSNELRHEKVNELFTDFIRQTSFPNMFTYPYPHDVEKAVAKQFGVTDEVVLLTAGSDDAIKTIVQALTAKTKNMIIQTPNYENYEIYGRLNRVHIIPVAWYFDSAHFLSQFTNIAKNEPPSLVVVTTPNGWTGCCLRYEELREIARLSEQSGHLVCIDQAYVSFSNLDYTPLLREFSNLLFVWSFSKSMGLAGFRIGAVFADEYLIRYLKKWRPTNPVNRLALEFLRYCLDRMEVMEEMQSQLVEERQKWRQTINQLELGVRAMETHTNFLLLQAKNKTVCDELIGWLQEHGIAVRGFPEDPHLNTAIRMTVPGPHEREVVLDCLSRFPTKRNRRNP